MSCENRPSRFIRYRCEMSRRTRLGLVVVVVGAVVAANVGMASVASATTTRAEFAESSRMYAQGLVDVSAGRAFIDVSELRAQRLRDAARATHGVHDCVVRSVQLRVERVAAVARARAPRAPRRLATQSRAPPEVCS